MKTEFFEQLIAIAESKNMSEAAIKLNMAQPTLSLSMKNFERELNAEIFEINGRQKKLTPFGEELYRRAKVIDEEVKDLIKLSQSRKGTLKFLSVSNNFALLGKDAMLDLYERYKTEEVNFKIEDCAINLIMDNVAAGRSEIGVLRFFANKKSELQRSLQYYGLEYESLAWEDICVVVGEQNPLYNIENDSIDVNYLNNLSFISHYTEIMDSLWMSCLKEINARKITMSLASVGNVMAALRKTDTAFIDTKKDNTHDDWYNNIRYIKIEPQTKCELGWIKLKNKELTEIASEYIDILKERIRRWGKADKTDKTEIAD